MVSNYKTVPVKNFIDGELCTVEMSTKKSRKFSKILVRVSLGIILISIFLLNVTMFIKTMNKSYRIHDMQNEQISKLQEEINILRRDVDILKQGFVDSDDNLMKELSDDEFKDFYYDTDTESSTDNSPFNTDDTDFDDNYDMSYFDTLLDKVLQSGTTSLPTTTTDSEDDKNKRSKREVLAATIDGVPIIAESYAERKQRNRTLHRSGEGLKLYETLGKNTEAPGRNVENRKHSTTHTFKTSGWTSRTFVNSARNEPTLPGVSPTPVMSRSSRVMQTNEDKSKAFRRIVKKTMPKSSTAQLNSQETTNGHRSRHSHKLTKKRSNLETMDEHLSSKFRTSIPAAHYHGDTTYSHRLHLNEHGHLAHPQGYYVDWVPSNWMRSLEMDHRFHMHNGNLKIKEAGLYFVYAQIFYVDVHDVNAYRINKNNVTDIAQCTTMAHSNPSHSMKKNTCYTATVEYFEEGDTIMVRDIESKRHVFFKNGKSFFGLYKISDAKLK